MTRVALLLSAHPREYKKCLENLGENVFSKIDTDVFLSLWDKEPEGSGYHPSLTYFGDSSDRGLSVEEIRHDFKQVGAKEVVVYIEKYSDDINKLPDSLKNKLMNKKWYDNPYYYRHGLISLWYKINQCHALRREYEKENDVKYDIVIRARTDVFFTKPFDELDISDKMNTYIDGPGHQAERLWFGPPELMDRTAQLYDDLEEIYDIDHEKIRHSHHIKEFYMRQKGIPYINRPVNTAIYREEYIHY